MATLLEHERTETQAQTQTREAQLHNAGINERYRRLAAAEERQFGESNATESTVRASVLAPERPVFNAPVAEDIPAIEQIPTVTEYVRTPVQSPVFTTEKFNSIAEEQPVAVQAPVEMPAQAPVAAVSVSQEAQYSLSRMAKMVMAAFATLVMVMLVAIGINSRIISQKTLQLQALEAQRAELLEENAEIQSRIAQARSEETIREYAQSQGMIESNR
ncbi:MAG: hypothetical protein J6B56_04555 [Clostridia bacterium]|nr:hypothetical protein [Clostridia bacterium]